MQNAQWGALRGEKHETLDLKPSPVTWSKSCKEMGEIISLDACYLNKVWFIGVHGKHLMFCLKNTKIIAQKTEGSFMKPHNFVGLWNDWNIWSIDSGFFFFFFFGAKYVEPVVLWFEQKPPPNWWLLTHQIPAKHSQHWCEAVLGGYQNFMIPARSGFHKIIYKGSRFHFFFPLKLICWARVSIVFK